MEINRENVMEIIAKSGLKPDKDYGQNYLLDTNICNNIVSLANISETDNVLEIGPGLGSLTHFICLNDVDITLVDIDQRMVDFLKILYSKPNVNIVLNDIRKHDVSKYTKIIGNLPYNITTEAVIYLLENASNADTMVLMCQQEALARFTDLSGKEYGPASILVHLLGSIKKNLVVKPGSFYPMPKCSSTVFTINVDKTKDRELALAVYYLSKKLFLNRRKTIYNNLSSYLGDKEKAISILNELNIPQSKRPEELSPEMFLKIYQKCKSNK